MIDFCELVKSISGKGLCVLVLVKNMQTKKIILRECSLVLKTHIISQNHLHGCAFFEVNRRM